MILNVLNDINNLQFYLIFVVRRIFDSLIPNLDRHLLSQSLSIQGGLYDN
jgi:hypothetical protein